MLISVASETSEELCTHGQWEVLEEMSGLGPQGPHSQTHPGEMMRMIITAVIAADTAHSSQC